MSVFKHPTLGYSIVPWRDYASLFPTKDELRTNISYGRIPVPNWESIKRFFNPEQEEKHEEKGPAPPPRRKQGGGFPSYVIHEIPLAELQARLGNVHAYEDGDVIWVGKELSKKRKLEAIVHEYASKLLRQENPNFDHELQHDEVYALVDRFARSLLRHYKN